MNTSLENWLRDRLYEVERMHEYSIGTDTVRAWIDLYNEVEEKNNSAKDYLSTELDKYDNIKIITNEVK